MNNEAEGGDGYLLGNSDDEEDGSGEHEQWRTTTMNMREEVKRLQSDINKRDSNLANKNLQGFTVELEIDLGFNFI